MQKPDAVYLLPDTLREVSGISMIDSTTIACIQDENGIIFIFDITQKKIIRQHVFNGNGDYEDIVCVNSTLYILRSDGTLFEVSDYASKNYKTTIYPTGIPARNNEGLCYDADKDQLFIACKSKAGKGRLYKDRRLIFSFDLKRKILSLEPVFDFSVNMLEKFALLEQIPLPMKKKKKHQKEEETISLKPSAIAIHPLTKKVFLLSADEYLLFIFDKTGTIEHIELLDKNLFAKAEGITFLPDGTMFISNEAVSQKATLLEFKPINK